MSSLYLTMRHPQSLQRDLQLKDRHKMNALQGAGEQPSYLVYWNLFTVCILALFKLLVSVLIKITPH